MTPEIEPGLFGKALDWVVTGIGALLATVWGFLRADIRRIEESHGKTLVHIETLYRRAEDDREKTRNMIDASSNRINDTMQVHQRDIMQAIAEMTRKCGK